MNVRVWIRSALAAVALSVVTASPLAAQVTHTPWRTVNQSPYAALLGLQPPDTDDFIDTSDLDDAITLPDGADPLFMSSLPNDPRSLHFPTGLPVGPIGVGYAGPPAAVDFDAAFITDLVKWPPHPKPDDKDKSDWLRWRAYWRYAVPPLDPVTVKVQIIWEAHYLPMGTPTPAKPIAKIKTIVLKSIPGNSDDGSMGPSVGWHANTRLTPIKFNGRAALQANAPKTGNGLCYYDYIYKIFLFRDTYGAKLCEARRTIIVVDLYNNPTR